MPRERRAVVFDGKAVVVEEPLPPIPAGHVMVRVERAVWGGIENAVSTGVLWVEPGRVLGFSGVGRVVETGIGVERLRGGDRVVTGVAERGLFTGVEVDGWLATYTVLPEEVLTRVDGVDADSAALAPYAAIASWIADTLSSCRRVALLGCGVTGFLARLSLSDLGIEHQVFGECRGAYSYSRLPEYRPECAALLTLNGIAIDYLSRTTVRLLAVHPVYQLLSLRIPAETVVTTSKLPIPKGVELISRHRGEVLSFVKRGGLEAAAATGYMWPALLVTPG